jgi:hypothetical protein
VQASFHDRFTSARTDGFGFGIRSSLGKPLSTNAMNATPTVAGATGVANVPQTKYGWRAMSASGGIAEVVFKAVRTAFDPVRTSRPKPSNAGYLI